jgi:RNA polymerase sigma-B factor
MTISSNHARTDTHCRRRQTGQPHTDIADPVLDRPPTRDDDQWVNDLLREYRRTRDRALRNAVVREYRSLAVAQARSYDRTSEPLDDRIQVALLGLVKAADRFDPDYGAPFVAFAAVTVRGELQRHFRDHGWGVRVPRRVQELRYRVRWATGVLGEELGRSPRPDEVASHLGVSLDEVIEALFADDNFRPRSIDSGGDGRSAAELVADKSDPGFDAVDADDSFRRLVQCCSPRLQRILYLRFVEGLKQSEIAEQLGVSQVQISRLLRQAIAELRETAGIDIAEPAAS